MTVDSSATPEVRLVELEKRFGDVVAVDADGFTVVCPDGRIKVTRVKPDDGPKVGAGEWAAASGLAVGARFT